MDFNDFLKIKSTTLEKRIASQIDDLIKGSIEVINYGKPSVNEQNNIDMDPQNPVVQAAKKHNVYLILDENKNVKYIGSGAPAYDRLYVHLIKNNQYDSNGVLKESQTGSTLTQVYNYVISLPEGSRKMYYISFAVEPWYFYQAVENILISYYSKYNKKQKLESLWNTKGTSPR